MRKVWTKLVVFVLVALYTLVFVAKNSEEHVMLWIFPNRTYQRSALVLILLSFAAGVVAFGERRVPFC